MRHALFNTTFIGTDAAKDTGLFSISLLLLLFTHTTPDSLNCDRLLG